MTAQDYFRAGQLQEAIDACTAEVRQNPTDGSRRGLLCELLCFAGEYERADRQLDALGHQDPQIMTGISTIRQLLRAEQARQQFYSEGRLPEFLAPPSPWLRLHLEASIHLRERRPDEGAPLLADAETQRPRLSGICDGRPFDDFRDLDDLTACFFEVLTSNGKYYWIPAERVELVEFHPWQRPHDLLWRRAHMIVRDGPDGEVFLPALYAGASAESDDRLRLGRMTEWRGGDNEPVRGAGQRMFWIGGEERPILEIQTLTLNPQPGASAD
ncbi:MAG TPA: type VI secretion system accessory protein TagJ [Gemmataceae bacterium]|jgi:type VI secretion system protein ImpE